MKHLDLFSGIGGFALAARWMGWQTIGFIEKDKFCQKVLAKHWSGVQIEEDIKNVTADTFRQHPDIITGGFPCQPFSVAGKRRGKEDDRYLWPEMVRVIKEYKPRWVLGENVAGIIPMELDSVLSDLAIADYEVWPLVIPACGVDAKHRRNRVWIVAHSRRWQQSESSNSVTMYSGTERATRSTSQISGSSSNGRAGIVADPTSEQEYIQYSRTSRFGECGRLTVDDRQEAARPEDRQASYDSISGRGETLADSCEQQRNGRSNGPCRWEREPLEALRDARRRGRQEDGLSIPESLLGRVADGIPNRVDRLRSLGNAIVPQVAFEIFRAIEASEKGQL